MVRIIIIALALTLSACGPRKQPPVDPLAGLSQADIDALISKARVMNNTGKSREEIKAEERYQKMRAKEAKRKAYFDEMARRIVDEGVRRREEEVVYVDRPTTSSNADIWKGVNDVIKGAYGNGASPYPTAPRSVECETKPNWSDTAMVTTCTER